MALEQILSFRMRSFLTMLGIIIGVSSLVVMVSFVNGATKAIGSEVNSLGSDMIAVVVFNDKNRPLDMEDLEKLKNSPLIDSIAPANAFTASAKYKNTSRNISLYCTTPSYASIRALKLNAGRFLLKPDVENVSSVAVVSHNVAKELFNTTDIIGESIYINGQCQTVIGVLAPDTSLSSTVNSGNEVFVPISAMPKLLGIDTVSIFYISPVNSDQANRAVSFLHDYLVDRFGSDEEAYDVVNMTSLTTTLEQIMIAMKFLLGGVAAIALFVGGIGIMNIMLVSVTERKKEIGIRKAVGAKQRDILLQFLIETLVICSFGCLIGIALSVGILCIATRIASEFISISFQISGPALLLAISSAMLVGIVFGFFPARKAAKLQCILALKSPS